MPTEPTGGGLDLSAGEVCSQTALDMQILQRYTESAY
jgi:hypothetical protein